MQDIPHRRDPATPGTAFGLADAAYLRAWLLRVCWIAIPVLVAMNILDRWVDDRLPLAIGNMLLGKFHLNAEFAIPAWFSVQLIFLSALATGGLAWREKRRGGPDVWRYALLALVLLFLSADESAGLHEMLTDLSRERLGLSGVFYYAWVVPVGLAAGCVALAMLPLLLRVPAGLRNAMIAGGAVYVLGAIGMEMLAGPYEEAGQSTGIPYFTLMTLEESFEMIGMLIYLQATSGALVAAGAALPRERSLGPVAAAA